MIIVLRWGAAWTWGSALAVVIGTMLLCGLYDAIKNRGTPLPSPRWLRRIQTGAVIAAVVVVLGFSLL